MTTENNKKKSGILKVCLGLLAVAAVIAVMLFAYHKFSEKAVEGSKAITIEVVGKEKDATYELKTDAKYLVEAMDEAKGLTYEMADGMINTINGETADYSKNSSYWAIYVNDEYGMYGANEQPVEDGDVFKFEYTVFVAE